MKHLRAFENIFEDLPVDVNPEDIKKHHQYKALVADPEFEDEKTTFDFFVLDKVKNTIMTVLITDDLTETALKSVIEFAKENTVTDFITAFSDSALTEENLINWYIKDDRIETQYGHEIKVLSAI